MLRANFRPSRDVCFAMTDTPSFTVQEHKAVQATLAKRWSKDEIDLQIVEVDARDADSNQDAITCPAYFWEYGDYYLLVLKTGESTYRPQFFYQQGEEAGVEKLEFDDIAECTMALLQLQANHSLLVTAAKDKA